MGVVDRLSTLDERAGAGPTVDRARWAKDLRLWWVGLAVPYVVVAAGLVVFGYDTLRMVVPALVAVPAVFWSGFLYNERLRSLGRRPRFAGRLPAGWPRETT